MISGLQCPHTRVTLIPATEGSFYLDNSEVACRWHYGFEGLIYLLGTISSIRHWAVLMRARQHTTTSPLRRKHEPSFRRTRRNCHRLRPLGERLLDDMPRVALRAPRLAMRNAPRPVAPFPPECDHLRADGRRVIHPAHPLRLREVLDERRPARIVVRAHEARPRLGGVVVLISPSAPQSVIWFRALYSR